jgi:hypothetical protein
MKQYRVFYRRAGSEKWGTLEPGLHAGLYDVPPVNAALEAMRTNPSFEAIAVRHEDAQFNIIVFEQEAHAPKSFILNPPGAQPS